MWIPLPATSDYWVNDSAGDPLFVVAAEANPGLVKMLPGILAQVKALVGKRRPTVVFDRGGYSLKLFQQILAAGLDLLASPVSRTAEGLLAPLRRSCYARSI
jgi:hypothetical protein